jgi:DNA-binding transcriptional ArsR family regulator
MTVPQLYRMDLDFRAIKALSSRTRIKILRELLREEATAERLKQSVDSAPDQVVMTSRHCRTLTSSMPGQLTMGSVRCTSRQRRHAQS